MEARGKNAFRTGRNWARFGVPGDRLAVNLIKPDLSANFPAVSCGVSEKLLARRKSEKEKRFFRAARKRRVDGSSASGSRDGVT